MTKLVEDHKDNDAQKPEDKKALKDNETNEYLAKMRSRQYDKLPLKFVGKGPGGYILYDIVHHRGHSSPHVSRQFGAQNRIRKKIENNKKNCLENMA